MENVQKILKQRSSEKSRSNATRMQSLLHCVSKKSSHL